MRYPAVAIHEWHSRNPPRSDEIWFNLFSSDYLPRAEAGVRVGCRVNVVSVASRVGIRAVRTDRTRRLHSDIRHQNPDVLGRERGAAGRGRDASRNGVWGDSEAVAGADLVGQM